jgi:hypothetical protein
MSRRDVQPVAIDQLEKFDRATRLAALRLTRTALTGPPHHHRLEIDDTLASDRLRDIVDCLAQMAAGAFPRWRKLGNGQPERVL